jgi:glycosyltransferase involved in cell wall biosynthesis
MTTLHFIYPHGPFISAPHSIGRHVAPRLQGRYEVLQYDWDDTRVIDPGPDDILLGHPHPAPWTVFRRSAKRRGWKRTIALFPYNHDPRNVAFFDSTVSRCDLVLAMTGNFWFDSILTSPFWHWAPKMIHVDMAIDRSEFPVIKTRFNPPGSRRFLYIGYTNWQKNTRYLSKLAKRAPGCEISWMGSGRRGIRRLTKLGPQDFSSEKSRRLVAEHDFLLMVGRADSNPTTILEAMAWGLVPVCTPTSGYIGYPGIPNVPLDDAVAGVNMLESLQTVPETRLLEMQMANWRILNAHFNWDRLVGQILAAIQSQASPSIRGGSVWRRTGFRAVALKSPLATVRRLRSNLRLLVRRPNSG